MPIEVALPRLHPAPPDAIAPGTTFAVAMPWQRIVNGMLALAVASGFVAFVEPSPYDVLILAAFGLWAIGGFRVHPLIVPLAALLFLYNLGGFFALIPHLDEPDPTTFMVLSVYLALTALLFAILFAENTVERAELCLRAYSAGCVVTGLGAIAGYFNIAGLQDSLTLYGRASSTFKDPNVMGSYLTLGALYYIQALVLGTTRRTVTTLLGLTVIVAGVFLSFSRGSWGVLIAGTVLVVGLAWLTQGDSRVRRRVLTMVVVAIGLAVVAIAILLSIDSVREMFTQRFALVQDYDGGETGRFGNQMRAIPMLIDRLNGFGPVRFRLFFDEDSHSSYIGAFSSYGWLGGSAFLLLVGLTTFIGLRQVLSPSPFQRVAQVYFPCFFVLSVQAAQIDIDHWRHVYLLLGAIWGIEAARLRWRDAEER